MQKLVVDYYAGNCGGQWKYLTQHLKPAQMLSNIAPLPHDETFPHGIAVPLVVHAIAVPLVAHVIAVPLVAHAIAVPLVAHVIAVSLVAQAVASSLVAHAMHAYAILNNCKRCQKMGAMRQEMRNPALSK